MPAAKTSAKQLTKKVSLRHGRPENFSPMFSPSRPSASAAELPKEGLDKYPSKTLVFENVHARSSPNAILFLLDKLADLDPYAVREIRIRNVKKRGRFERHAFVEFWRLDHAVWVFEHVNHFIHVQCPKPRPGEVGQVVDEDGNPVNGFSFDDNDDKDPTAACSAGNDGDVPVAAAQGEGKGNSTKASSFSKDGSAKPTKRFFTEVRIVFWTPYHGRADQSIQSVQGWQCAECGLPNYEKWEFCYRCGVERPWSENILFRPREKDVMFRASTRSSTIRNFVSCDVGVGGLAKGEDRGSKSENWNEQLSGCSNKQLNPQLLTGQVIGKVNGPVNGPANGQINGLVNGEIKEVEMG